MREVALLLPRKLRRPILDEICRRYGHNRLTLPEVDGETEFPGFANTAVTVRGLPDHFWTSPVNDQIALTKIAVVTGASRILEIGSFRGNTALMLAENTPPETQITAVDILEDHGGAYRGRSVESRIRRHVGSLESLPAGGAYDLIFVDADHREQEVERDTRLALPLLAPDGTMVWHDYRDSYWLSGVNRVPEVLGRLAETLPVRSLRGTTLAFYRAPPD